VRNFTSIYNKLLYQIYAQVDKISWFTCKKVCKTKGENYQKRDFLDKIVFPNFKENE